MEPATQHKICLSISDFNFFIPTNIIVSKLLSQNEISEIFNFFVAKFRLLLTGYLKK